MPSHRRRRWCRSVALPVLARQHWRKRGDASGPTTSTPPRPTRTHAHQLHAPLDMAQRPDPCRDHGGRLATPPPTRQSLGDRPSPPSLTARNSRVGTVDQSARAAFAELAELAELAEQRRTTPGRAQRPTQEPARLPQTQLAESAATPSPANPTEQPPSPHPPATPSNKTPRRVRRAPTVIGLESDGCGYERISSMLSR